MSFDIRCPESGVLRVTLVGDDDLPVDDSAWTVVPEPRRLRVLLVTEGNPPLESAFKACPLAGLEVVEPAEFEKIASGAASGLEKYGLVVLDRFAPDSLPPGNYLVFGKPPAASGVAAIEKLKNRMVVDWNERDPLLDSVNLENLFVSEAWELKPPRDARIPAEFPTAPALVVRRKRNALFILAPFDVLKSNWPFDPGFVMFCYNVVAFLGNEAGGLNRFMLEVGEPLIVETRPPRVAKARLRGPGGLDVTLESDPGGVFRFPGTRRVGIYRFQVEGGGERVFAVNLLDTAESDIRPRNRLNFSGGVVEGRKSDPVPANRELWPLLVFLGLLVVCAEWLVYNKKVKL